MNDHEKAAVLAFLQPNGRPYFMPWANMTDEQRLAHIDICKPCQKKRDEILAEIRS
jgi:predicted Fe-S protein YdhL (DUF1289 family)